METVPAGVVFQLKKPERFRQEHRCFRLKRVVDAKRGFQAVTLNRNAGDLFACKWLRARDFRRSWAFGFVDLSCAFKKGALRGSEWVKRRG